MEKEVQPPLPQSSSSTKSLGPNFTPVGARSRDLSMASTSQKGKAIVDRPVPRGKTEVSLSAFCFLFSEMVQYYQTRVNTTQELEKKLAGAGYGVGARMLELVCFREKAKRETRIVGMLSHIKDNIWKAMFGKVADALERSTEREDEYMIHEKEPLVNTYVSVPKDFGHLNCASFVAGAVHGMLDSADFPARVTAHTVQFANESRTTILIKFSQEVMEREKRLG